MDPGVVVVAGDGDGAAAAAVAAAEERFVGSRTCFVVAGCS
jgi:hypothetical protein